DLHDQRSRGAASLAARDHQDPRQRSQRRFGAEALVPRDQECRHALAARNRMDGRHGPVCHSVRRALSGNSTMTAIGIAVHTMIARRARSPTSPTPTARPIGLRGLTTRFITQKLKLKVNETKSAVARPQERKFLGFSFSTGPEIKRMIAPKALERFKHRIRETTRRAKGVSMETTIAELAPYLRGWRSYFGFCETPDVLIYLTRWVRLRLRAALWRQWKTPRRRRAALLALGVRPRLASNTAGSGRGPWYLARAKALSVGLSNAHFKSLGLPTLIDGC